MFIYKYHHTGFDIVANRILETVERYASRYDPRYQKIYWITGEAGGGSVANLLAQKMIKKYGNKNIYCYTFQALNTINYNNIPAVQRISNEPYESIFNLYNDDNELIKLYSNDNNFYKYGINKHVAVSNSNEYIELWQKATGKEYKLTSKTNNAKLFLEWMNSQEEGMVSGFSFSESLNYFVNATRDTIIRFTAFFRTLGRTHTSEDVEYIDPTEQSIYNKAETEAGAKSDNDHLASSGDSSGIPDAIGNIQDRKADSVNSNAYIDDDNDPRNGYKFINEEKFDLDYKELNLESITTNNANLHTIKFNNSNYVYGNWTLKDEDKFWDIDFTKFWNITTEEQEKINNIKARSILKTNNENSAHMHLFDIKAGDFGYNNIAGEDIGKTLTTIGSCFNKSRINTIVNTELNYGDIFDAVKNSDGVVAFDKDIKNSNSIVGKFLTIDGRIVAAFPLVALVGENSDSYKTVGRNMHMFNKYFLEIDKEKEGSYHGESANDGKDSIYKYVDVVFEKAGNKKHQYVVPFMVIDAKAIHYRPNIEGFFGTFVDNRFGQVYQYKEDLKTRDNAGKIKNIKVENPMQLYYDGKDYQLLSEEDAAQIDLLIAIGNSEVASWRKITDANYLEYYPDKDEIRGIRRISPIEPYVNLDKDEYDNEFVGTDTINQDVANSLLLTPKDKIVCMRVYERKFDKNDKRHFLDIRDDISKIKLDDPEELVLSDGATLNVIIDYSQ